MAASRSSGRGRLISQLAYMKRHVGDTDLYVAERRFLEDGLSSLMACLEGGGRDWARRHPARK
eukprot:7299557-Prorocentrum_lima.AAC.1